MNQRISTVDYSSLPAHIITQILGYLKLDDLKSASLVSKSFYYASTDPQIIKTFAIRPTEENFSEICKSNRKYGVLDIKRLRFDKSDDHYFELFKKICPLVYELLISYTNSNLKIHHLLKILEFSTRLESFSLSQCSHFAQLPSLFPLEYDCNAKNRIVKNLSAIRTIAFGNFLNISFIADVVKYAKHLNTFRLCNGFSADGYDSLFRHFFTIFNNCNTGNLKRFDFISYYPFIADDFLTSFVKIKDLNLTRLRIRNHWVWTDGIYKSSLFHQFILKLQSLVVFYIDQLTNDQLTLICQHLVNLKILECRLWDNDHAISELGNLKRLEVLRCNYKNFFKSQASLIEINNFFKCKFEYLLIFNFDEFISESNLVQFCENHPNLIELKLNRLLTRNLEIIFKCLTKLRVLVIFFGFKYIVDEERDSVNEISLLDSNKEYEFKISRLVDLEYLILDEPVNELVKNDATKLKKLQSTNLTKLFVKRNETSKCKKRKIVEPN